MTKRIFVILCASGFCSGAVLAQTAMPGPGGPTAEPRGGGPSRVQFVTATGATVPKPALLPRDLGQMRAGRSAYEKDRQIEKSLCSNC